MVNLCVSDHTKRLLSSRTIQTGFERLWEMGRLDLSVEAHVLMDRYWGLFHDEGRREARDRLIEYDERFFGAHRDEYQRHWQWVAEGGIKA